MGDRPALFRSAWPAAAAVPQPQAGYSETFFTNCDFRPICPMPGIRQSMS